MSSQEERMVSQEKKKYTHVHIRWMVRCDMPEVLAIEQSSFQDPWKEDDFLSFLRQHNCVGMVAEIEGKVLAFFLYELHKGHFRLLNLCVHSDYRHQGIGRQMIAKLFSKLSPKKRSKILALLPPECKKMSSFFKKYGNIEIRPTEQKGRFTYKPGLSAMTVKDAKEAQIIEDDFMQEYGKTPRQIEGVIAHGTRYGIVARDKLNGELLGYALYIRELTGIELNGEFGIIVRPECRNQGIGRKLMMELASQKLSIKVSDIYLLCKDQVAFLRAMGVAVPKLEKYATVMWTP